MLGRVARLVGGDADEALVKTLERIREAALAVLKGAWWEVAGGVDGAYTVRLRQRLEALPHECRGRIETAPEFWTLLCNSRSGCDLKSLSLLGAWIAAEDALARNPPALSGSRWTALGDYLIEADGRVAFEAPRLPCGAVLDWQSPNALTKLPEISGEFQPFTIEEARDACRNLFDAHALVSNASAHWGALMGRFLRVVLLRRDPSSDAFSSATSRLAVGRPVLRNPHLPASSPEVVADGLVHEAVHTLLDHLELTDPIVCSEEHARDALIPSNWTGRPLDLNTYIHACLVWFALSRFWMEALRAGAGERETVIRLLTSRTGGFFHGPALADAVLPYRRALAADVPEVLEEIQRKAKAMLA